MVYRSSLTGPGFGLRREIDRLFEDTFGRDTTRAGWVPAVDIREDNKAIVLEVELPGIKPEDVEVTAENGVLTVRGEKQSTSSESGEGRYHVIERAYGSFSRSFQLPQGVDEQRIEADFTNGLLMIHVPKAALPQPRRIEIRNGAGQPSVRGTPATPAGATGGAASSRRASRATGDEGSGEPKAARGAAEGDASRANSRTEP